MILTSTQNPSPIHRSLPKAFDSNPTPTSTVDYVHFSGSCSDAPISARGIKEFAKIAAGGAMMGMIPVAGAGIGAINLNGLGFGSSTYDKCEGAALIATNLIGTGCLLAGDLASASLALGISGLLGAVAVAGDNTFALRHPEMLS